MRLTGCILGIVVMFSLASSGLAAKMPPSSMDATKVTMIAGQEVQSEPQASSSSVNAGEQIKWQVVANGGGTASSVSFENLSTVGQTATGEISSANYKIIQGFIQNFGPPPPSCVSGDADGSGGVDIDDVVYLIAYIFSGGPPPTPDLCCGDADGLGGIDIDDVVYLIAYIFSGGPPPVDIC